MTGLENTSGYMTLQATAAAIPAYTRVMYDSNGLISAAGVSGGWIGITTEYIAASGYGTVKLRNAPGTFPLVASAAITRGAALYTAASGKVASSGTTLAGLVAFEAATTTNDVIQCIPYTSFRN